MARVGDGRIDHVRRRDPVALHFDRGGIDARHVEEACEQVGQAAQFCRGGIRLGAPAFDRQLVAKVLDRRADHGQRRLQIVAERRQQRRCQLAALSRQRRGFMLLQQLRPLNRSPLALLRRRKEVAANDGGDEKCDERHPVVRVGDREGADRREEKVIERQRRRHRHGDGDPFGPEGGGEQDQDQQRETRGRRIHSRDQTQDGHCTGDGAEGRDDQHTFALGLIGAHGCFAILPPLCPRRDSAATF